MRVVLILSRNSRQESKLTYFPKCRTILLKKWSEWHYRIDDDQVSIVGPGAQLHAAVLEVKGEMQHNNFTVALEDGRWVPRDHSCVLQQHFGLMNDGKVTVSTVGTDKHSINMGDNKLNINAGGRQCLRMGQCCCRTAQPTSAQLGIGCCGSGAGCQGKTAVCQMQHMVGGGGGGPAIHPDLA